MCKSGLNHVYKCMYACTYYTYVKRKNCFCLGFKLVHTSEVLNYVTQYSVSDLKTTYVKCSTKKRKNPRLCTDCVKIRDCMFV